ncbi:MAG TPA: hypothetical protein VK324_04495 [Tepidisphaeraceae bacterium]|nr:hypothetical protein [Tepidisphaeraceae bacterium]
MNAVAKINLNLQHSEARCRRVGERTDADGGYHVTLYLDYGAVECFTYPGGGHGAAFTQFRMYLPCREYWARLPRHYSKGWISRLANQFGSQCWHKNHELDGRPLR